MARGNKKKMTWKFQIMIILTLLCGVLFSAVSLILVVGMVPSIVAGIADRGRGRYQTISVASMNFAACAPFILDVLHTGGGISAAIALISQPKTIVMMYMGAAAGYLIDWSLTGIVSAVMAQKARARLRQIEKTQADLSAKWGPEVTGTMPLDDYGFPREGYTPPDPSRERA